MPLYTEISQIEVKVILNCDKKRRTAKIAVRPVEYSKRDLNPHSRNGQGILSPSCLPIPPFEHPQKESGKRGSNSRPQPWQGCALPTELFPHSFLTGAKIRAFMLTAKFYTRFFISYYIRKNIIFLTKNVLLLPSSGS